MNKGRIGTSSTTSLSPERQKRNRRRRAAQDKFWKSKNGPVTSYRIPVERPSD